MKTALIGCGNIGGKRAPHAAAHPDSMLTMVVDKDAARARAFASQYNCAHAADWESVLKTDVEAAIVCVPARHMHEIVMGLLDTGLHVLCEKPLGRDLMEAREITERSRERGVVLEVGLNLRFDAGLQTARALVSEGALGDLYFIKCDYVNGAVLSNTNEVGSLLDMGLHCLDLVTWFMGGVDSIYGDLSAHEHKHDDNGFAFLRKGRILAEIHFSFVRWRNLFRFEASGSKGYVLVESLPKWGNQVLTYGTRVYPSGPPREERSDFSADRSWEREWDYFVRCAAGQQVQVDTDRGLQCMLLAALVRKSARLGMSIPVAGAVETRSSPSP